MLQPIHQPGDNADPFKLHYVKNAERCVVRFDTFDEAMRTAVERLEKDPGESLWISDAANRPLLDPRQMQARFLQLQATDPVKGPEPTDPRPPDSTPTST